MTAVLKEVLIKAGFKVAKATSQLKGNVLCHAPPELSSQEERVFKERCSQSVYSLSLLIHPNNLHRKEVRGVQRLSFRAWS